MAENENVELMRIRFLVDVKSDLGKYGKFFPKDLDHPGLPKERALFFVQNGWAEDPSGEVPTGEFGKKDGILGVRKKPAKNHNDLDIANARMTPRTKSSKK